MAISQNKYINIVSSVGGGSAIGRRDLMGRVFSKNKLIPTGTILEFVGGASIALEEISEYFGATSNEYKFASKYFQADPKNSVAPQKLSFAGYNNSPTSAYLFGAVKSKTLDELKSISAGDFKITVNSQEKTYNDINFSSASDLATVASKLNEKITGDGLTAEYDATDYRFIVKTTATGAGQKLSFATGAVAVALGMVENKGVLSDGADALNELQAVMDTTELSNNFFSFTFLENDLIASDIKSIAEWTNNQNVNYLFSITAKESNVNTIRDAVVGYNGVAITLDKYDEWAGFMPMSRIACIDFTKQNSAISMYYQRFAGVKPSVDTTEEARNMSALRVNYYGSTQMAGERVSFYQNGILMGDIADMGVYANEAWLKDSFLVNLVNLRLGLNTLPANKIGKALVLSVLTQTVNDALYNGTVLLGKELDAQQKAYIAQITGVNDAWLQVQNNGFYLDANLKKYLEDGVEKYKVSFLFIYGKGDSVNYIDGRDILI